MKSITIHGMEKPLADLIQAKARSEGLSVNKTVKKLLEKSLGVKPASGQRNRPDFSPFCSVWSEADLQAFEGRTKDLGEIDPEDWR